MPVRNKDKEWFMEDVKYIGTGNTHQGQETYDHVLR